MGACVLIRIGILALPLAGLLSLVGLLGRYGTPNPRAAGSMSYFASRFLGNVVGLTMLLFGVPALMVYLANTRARKLALGAMILGIAPVHFGSGR